MGILSKLFGNDDKQSDTTDLDNAVTPSGDTSPKPVEPITGEKMEADLEKLNEFENKIKGKEEGLEYEHKQRPVQRELTQAEKALRLKNPFRGI